MKKLLYLLSSLAFTTVPVSSIVACSNSTEKSKDNRVDISGCSNFSLSSQQIKLQNINNTTKAQIESLILTTVTQETLKQLSDFTHTTVNASDIDIFDDLPGVGDYTTKRTVVVTVKSLADSKNVFGNISANMTLSAVQQAWDINKLTINLDSQSLIVNDSKNVAQADVERVILPLAVSTFISQAKAVFGVDIKDQTDFMIKTDAVTGDYSHPVLVNVYYEAQAIDNPKIMGKVSTQIIISAVEKYNIVHIQKYDYFTDINFTDLMDGTKAEVESFVFDYIYRRFNTDVKNSSGLDIVRDTDYKMSSNAPEDQSYYDGATVTLSIDADKNSSKIQGHWEIIAHITARKEDGQNAVDELQKSQYVLNVPKGLNLNEFVAYWANAAFLTQNLSQASQDFFTIHKLNITSWQNNGFPLTQNDIGRYDILNIKLTWNIDNSPLSSISTVTLKIVDDGVYGAFADMFRDQACSYKANGRQALLDYIDPTSDSLRDLLKQDTHLGNYYSVFDQNLILVSTDVRQDDTWKPVDINYGFKLTVDMRKFSFRLNYQIEDATFSFFVNMIWEV